MKKMGIGWLCLLLAAAMTGCGGGSSQSASGSSAAGETASAAGTQAEGETAGTSGAAEAGTADTEAEYTATDYVTLGQYTGFEVEKAIAEVTDEDLDAAVEAELQENSEEVAVTDGAAEGNYLNVDYDLTVDGKAIEDASVTGFDTSIGYAEISEDVDNALLGAKAGDTVKVETTLDDTYGEEYDGKTGEYVIKVNSVYDYVAPELTDDYIKEITDYDNVEDYKAGLKEDLLASAEQYNQEEAGDQAFAMAVEKAVFNGYPQSLYDSCRLELEEYYDSMAEMFGWERSDVISEEELSEEAEEEVHDQLTMEAIAEKENLELTDEQYQEWMTDFMEEYGYSSVEEAEEENGKEYLQNMAFTEVVHQFVLDHCTVVEISQKDYDAKYHADEVEGETETGTDEEILSEESVEEAPEVDGEESAEEFSEAEE